jgi:GNAT superfamily N-acetyltransferase
MKGSSQKELSIETLVETSSSIRIIAQWLNEEWGHGRGYTYEDTLSWCRDLANSESEVVICAKLAERPVGAALLVDCDLPSHPHFGPWLSSLFVVPEHRRHGIGRSLTERLCEIAEERGHAELYLYALKGPLISFYRELGWSALEKFKIAGSEFVVMKKTLQKMDHNLTR